jgi:dihydropyrimidinase
LNNSVIPIVEAYDTLTKGCAYYDYGFHVILTNPTKKIVEQELPVLVREKGITSVKLYMTCDPMKLVDRQILDIIVATRKLGMTTMVHAENHDMISLCVLLLLTFASLMIRQTETSRLS